MSIDTHFVSMEQIEKEMPEAKKELLEYETLYRNR